MKYINSLVLSLAMMEAFPSISTVFIFYPQLHPKSICTFISPLVMNFSLGGFTALVTAVGLPEQVVGVALLNSAGQFGDGNVKANESEETVVEKFILKPLKESFQRIVLGVLFWQAKQPARIESVLKNVSDFRHNFESSCLTGYS